MVSIACLLLLLCWTGVARAVTYYVGAGGSDAAACTSHATRCATPQEAMSRSTATARTIALQCGDTFRTTSALNTNVAGTEANPNTITYYNDDDGSTCSAAPILTHSTLKTGWTVFSGNVYRATQTLEPDGWGLAQDGQRSDPETGQWDRRFYPPAGQSSFSCPSGLSTDHHWCWSGGFLYMVSTGGDPDTRYTNPGVEVTDNTASGAGIVADTAWWRVIGVKTYLTAGVGLSITASNTTVQDYTCRFTPTNFTSGISNGGPCIQVGTVTGQTLSGTSLTNVSVSGSGRDLIDLSGPGNIPDFTWNGGECFDAPQGPCMTTGHDNGTGTGSRGTITLRHLHIYDTCNAIRSSTKTFPGANAVVALSNSYIHDTLQGNDPRIHTHPTYRHCNPTDEIRYALWSDNHLDWIVTDSIIENACRGYYHGNTLATATFTNVTFINNHRYGVFADRGAGPVTVNRSVFVNSGTRECFVDDPVHTFAVDSGHAHIGCAGTCTSIVFAGGNTADTENYFYPADADGDIAYRDAAQTLAEWVALDRTGDSFSVVLGSSPLVSSSDPNIVAGSAANSCANIEPGVGAGRECGALEHPEIVSATTIDGNTIRFIVDTLTTPVVVTAANLFICTNVGGASCTSANDRGTASCTVEAAGTSFLCDISGPGLQAGDTITYGMSYAAVQSGLAVGGVFRGSALAVSTGAVTNTISGSGPTPTGCFVRNNNRNAIEVLWSAAFLPVNCTGFIGRRNGATWTQSACNPVSTNNTLIDFADDAAVGETITVEYTPTTGNATVGGVEPQAFTITCPNEILPAGTIWYVNGATGSDVNNDCTEAQNPATPKATIAGGIGCLSTSSTLQIAAGTYAEGITDSVPNGLSWTQPTTIRAAAGATVILQPTGAVFGILVSGSNNAPAYHVYDGLILDGTNSTVSTMRIEQGATHVRFQNGQLRNAANGNGLSLGNAHNTEIRATDIFGNSLRGIGGGSGGAQNNLFDRLTIYNNGGDGYYLVESLGGVQNNTLSRVAVRNNGGSGIRLSSGTADRVVNALLYDNASHGLEVLATKDGAIIENTTITQNGGTGLLNSGVNSTIRNTILFDNTAANLTDNGTGTSLTTNVMTDPSFAAPGTNDFHLANTSSAAYNTGTTIATVTNDFDGVVRPQFGSYDIGALEFNVPDSDPPQVSNCTPTGTFAAGTTAVTMACQTNEVATCRYDTTDIAYASMANTFSTTGALVHSTTVGSLTDGNTYTRYVRCIDAALNASPASQAVTFSVAFPDPTLSALLVTDAAPAQVRVTVNHFGSTPIGPALNCTGMSCQIDTGAGFTTWTINSCARAADDTHVLTMTSALANGNRYRCSYSRTGDIVNAAGQELVEFTNVNGTNGVDPDLPPTEGVRTQTHVRFCEAGLAGTLCSGIGFLDDGLDVSINTPPGAILHVAIEFDCTTNACSVQHYAVQACDNGVNCGDDQAGWYTLTSEFTNGRLARLVADPNPAVVDGAAITQSLSGCTLAGGYLYESTNTGLTLAVPAGQCGVIVGVWQLNSAAVSGNNVRFRVTTQTLGRLNTYTVVRQATAVSGVAFR